MRVPRALWAGLPVLVLFSACSSPEQEPTTWFVHATDPHLFEEPKHAKRQEPANERAFLRLLDTLAALPDSDVEPAFLLLTGDIGFGESGEGDHGTREARVGKLKDMLSEHPGLTIYLVPGNNDVEKEDLRRFRAAHEFVTDVQQQVRAAGVTLHDLTGCYLEEPAAGASCTADIAGTSFRLIGFPTFSFKPPKNETTCGQLTGAPSAADGATATTTAGPGSATGTVTTTASGAGSAPEADGETALAAQTADSGPDRTAPAGGEDQTRTKRDDRHRAWIIKLGELVKTARSERKRVLLATHIADLNDPHEQACGTVNMIAGLSPTPVGSNRLAPWTAWGVPEEVFDGWREIVGSPTVARALAGHFHDSHKEIYRSPYTWEHNPTGLSVIARADRGKTWLTPPLGIRLQADSPIQARGFALVGLSASVAERRLYWYDQVANTFTPDRSEDPESTGERSRAWSAPAAWLWLWHLPGTADPLEKTTVILIALLAAFLTIVAVWKIPPPDTLLTDSQSPPAPNPAPGSASGSSKETTEPSGPFDNNFARAVLGGLGGMVGVAFVDAFWKESSLDNKTYYIACFVVFFLTLLLLYGILRGIVEVIRSRIATSRQIEKLERPSRPGSQANNNAAASARGLKFVGTRLEVAGIWFYDTVIVRTRYWGRRLWQWVLSLRAAAVIFFDSVFNVIQGRNQLETEVMGRTIVKLQRSLVATLDSIAKEIHAAVLRALAEKYSIRASDCRVNITVLADDGHTLPYVSLSRGSLHSPFTPRSVAWIAMQARQARWWKQSYTDDEHKHVYGEIVIYDNSRKQVFPDWEESIKLGSVWQDRGPIDYKAFVVFPLPWLRGYREYRRGALHISLSEEPYLDCLWKNLDCPVKAEDGAEAKNGIPTKRVVNYENWSYLVGNLAGKEPVQQPGPEPAGKRGRCRELPEIQSESLNAVLTLSLASLPEVLKNLNMPLFESLIKPR